MKHFLKYIILIFCGGSIYYIIELTTRGYSHWSMFLTGGVCFVLMGLVNEFTPRMPLLKQMIVCMVIVTCVEFIVGCIVNLWIGWNVWDYSDSFCNILGQVCIRGSCYWLFLSAPAIVLDDYLRYWWFEEEKPYYRLR